MLGDDGVTTLLSGDGETIPLAKEVISKAEAPWWTNAMLKDAELKFQITYNTGFGTWLSVKIDDVDSDTWYPKQFAMPVPTPAASGFVPSMRRPAPVGEVSYPKPVKPQIYGGSPYHTPDENTMTFTCDARAGDRLSITFDNDAYRDSRTLHFLRRNAKPVLLFEEIEKADRGVIRFLTQLLSGSIPIESAGEFQLEDTIIIVTTCSGARTLAVEYLQSPCLPQKRILEVLAEGNALDEDVCWFPDKLLEYAGWQKLLLFPPQTVGDLCRVAEVELFQCSMKFRQEYGVDMVFSKQVPQLVLLSGDGLKTTEQVKSHVKDLFLEIVLMLFQDFEVNSRLSRLERVDVEVSTWDGERELMSRFEALCRDVSAKLPQDSTARVPYKLFLGACRDNHATVHLILQ